MKKKILNITLVFVMMISTICTFSGCGNKTEKIIVYINDGLSQSEITTIEDNLKSIDGVKSISFTSKAQALDEAKEKLPDGENLLNSYSDNNHPFPASFILEVKKSNNYDNIVKEIETIDGVRGIRTPTGIKDIIDAEKSYIRNKYE